MAARKNGRTGGVIPHNWRAVYIPLDCMNTSLPNAQVSLLINLLWQNGTGPLKMNNDNRTKIFKCKIHSLEY